MFHVDQNQRKYNNLATFFYGDSTSDIEVDYAYKKEEYVRSIYMYLDVSKVTCFFKKKSYNSFTTVYIRLHQSIEIVYSCLIQMAASCII
jgi:hypothetical protein